MVSRQQKTATALEKGRTRTILHDPFLIPLVSAVVSLEELMQLVDPLPA
jgi:hypothetical protein